MDPNIAVALIMAGASLITGPAAAYLSHRSASKAQAAKETADARAFDLRLAEEKEALEAVLWERLRTELARADERIATLEAEIGRLTVELDKERARNAELEAENRELSARVEELERKIQ